MILQPPSHLIAASVTTGAATIRRSEAGRRTFERCVEAHRYRTEPVATRPASQLGTAPAAIVDPIHTPEDRTAA